MCTNTLDTSCGTLTASCKYLCSSQRDVVEIVVPSTTYAAKNPGGTNSYAAHFPHHTYLRVWWQVKEVYRRWFATPIVRTFRLIDVVLKRRSRPPVQWMLNVHDVLVKQSGREYREQTYVCYIYAFCLDATCLPQATCDGGRSCTTR